MYLRHFNYKMLLGGALAVVLASVVVVNLRSFHRVKILDPRFEVLSAQVLRGTNLTFYYLGNRIEGRVRELLCRAGLNVYRAAQVSVRHTNDAYAFFVSFAGSSPP